MGLVVGAVVGLVVGAVVGVVGETEPLVAKVQVAPFNVKEPPVGHPPDDICWPFSLNLRLILVVLYVLPGSSNSTI